MRTGSLLFRFQNGGYEDDATPPQGARPMRDATERHLGEAVVRDLLAGGTGCGRLTMEPCEDRLWVEQKSGMNPSEFRMKGDTC